jgi:hypothetical protein
MSGEKINLEWLGNRVMTMSAEVRDLQLRFTALEGRFSAMEARIAALERMAAVRLDALASRFDTIARRQAEQEERMSRMLALLVRIAERLDSKPEAARNERFRSIFGPVYGHRSAPGQDGGRFQSAFCQRRRRSQAIDLDDRTQSLRHRWRLLHGAAALRPLLLSVRRCRSL